MRNGSRMAVLALCLGLTPLAARGQESNAESTWLSENRVNLVMQISGLGAEGCEIEIQPGHPGCKFEPLTRRIERVPVGSVVKLDTIPIEARSTSADRDCSFAITIREPGQPPRTFRRGIRLSDSAASDEAKKAQVLRCYLSTASLAARDAAATRVR